MSNYPANSQCCCAPNCAEQPSQNSAPTVPLCEAHIDHIITHRRDFLREQLDEYQLRRREIEKPKPATHLVYYIQFGDRIKIGTTSDLLNRIRALPFDELLAIEPGSTALERTRHLQFRNDRLQGEWFTASPELNTHIAKVRSEEHALPRSVQTVAKGLRGDVVKDVSPGERVRNQFRMPRNLRGY